MRASSTFVASAFAALAVTASVQSVAGPAAPRFEVAGYRLGMTNAQAARIGLSDCTTKNTRAITRGENLITCTGKAPDLSGLVASAFVEPSTFDGPFLTFDPNSKLLVRIEFVAFQWANPDPRTPQLLKLLNVEPCGDKWRFNGWHEDWTCAVHPDQVLSVKQTMGKTFLRKKYPSYLDVIAEVSRFQVEDLHKRRARDEAKARDEERKARSARELEAGR